MKRTWVTDVSPDNLSRLLQEFYDISKDYCDRTGAYYVKGDSKSGKSEEVGIYFEDPTATSMKKQSI